MDAKQVSEMANLLKMLVAAQDLPYFLAIQSEARDWLALHAAAVELNRVEARWGRQIRYHAERDEGQVVAESHEHGQQKMARNERAMEHGD